MLRVRKEIGLQSAEPSSVSRRSLPGPGAGAHSALSGRADM